MKTLTMRSAAHASAALHFPAHPIAGRVGTSLKHEHLQTILADERRDRFFEVHAENYMGAGGPPHAALNKIRQDYPLSLHGVCMSIGGPQSLDRAHLQRFKALVDRYEPALVSEHLAWSTHGSIYFNDLLPLPYTEATLARVADHIDQVQETVGRQLLLENPSTYLIFSESTMSETSFIAELVWRTGCGLLLNVSNVFVSATNHGFDALDYLVDFPLEHVGGIHLAGHARQADDEGELCSLTAMTVRSLTPYGSSSTLPSANADLSRRLSNGTATFRTGLAQSGGGHRASDHRSPCARFHAGKSPCRLKVARQISAPSLSTQRPFPRAARSRCCHTDRGRRAEIQGGREALQRLPQQRHRQSHQRLDDDISGDAAEHGGRFLPRDGALLCARQTTELAAFVRLRTGLSGFHRALRICAISAVAGRCGSDRAGMVGRLSCRRCATPHAVRFRYDPRGPAAQYRFETSSGDAGHSLAFFGGHYFHRQSERRPGQPYRSY